MKRLFKTFFVAAAAFFAVACNQASVQDIAREELETIMANHQAVGLAVVAVKDGAVVYSNTLGYKDKEAGTPWEENDVLRIASISKSFTATGIMQLVEQGKLDLDADASEIMGFEIRNPKYQDTPITVRMLLSHISSMSDANGYFTFDNLNRTTSPTWEKAWNGYEPGSKYQYCNLGYNTLGAIIEKVSGERFDQYIANHILKPLGVYANHNVHELDSARFVNIYRFNRKDSTQTRSDAYPSIAAALVNYTMGYSTATFSPTGGLKISAADLAKVMLMHMNQGTLNGVKILDSTSCALMQSEITATNYEGERYGMALLRTNDLLAGHRLVGHDGLALGAHTAMFWHPEKKFGFVVMTNGCSDKTSKVFPDIVCDAVECMYRNFIE